MNEQYFTELNGYLVKDKEAREEISNVKEELEDSSIIKEIEYTEFYNSNSKSKVHIVHVPHEDSKGNVIAIKHGFAHDVIDTGVEKATEFSDRNKTTLTINASVGAVQSQVTPDIEQGELLGLYIHEGTIIKDNRNLLTEEFLKNRYILGITATGLLKSYIGNTSSQTILNDGVIETVQAFIPILVDGHNNYQNLVNAGTTYWTAGTYQVTEDVTPDYDKIYYVLSNSEYIGCMNLIEFESGVTYYEQITGYRYQRQCIAQNTTTKEYYIITSDGKGQSENLGLTLEEFVTIARYYGCDFAFILDGGGSTTTVYRNHMINNATDDQTYLSSYQEGKGYTIREVPDFLYFSNEVNTDTDLNLYDLYSEIQKINRKVDDYILNNNEKYQGYTEFYGRPDQQHGFRFNQWNNELKEFVRKMTVYFNNTGAYPHGITITDDENSKEILRMHDNLNQGIRYLGKQLAIIVNNMENPTTEELQTLDLDNLTPTFKAYQLNKSYNLTNQPFTDDDTGVNAYWLIQWGGSYYKFQIAIGIKTVPVIKIRLKVDNWKAWKTIALES